MSLGIGAFELRFHVYMTIEGELEIWSRVGSSVGCWLVYSRAGHDGFLSFFVPEYFGRIYLGKL